MQHYFHRRVEPLSNTALLTPRPANPLFPFNYIAKLKLPGSNFVGGQKQR